MRKTRKRLFVTLVGAALICTAVLPAAGADTAVTAQAEETDTGNTAASSDSASGGDTSSADVSRPDKVTLKKVKAGGTSVKVTWKKVSSADGYCVYYRKAGGKWKKAKLVTRTTKTSCRITGLTAGKKYSFKVRAYKKADGSKVWGKYSAAKSVKIKKAANYVRSGSYAWYSDTYDEMLGGYPGSFVTVKKLSGNKIKFQYSFVNRSRYGCSDVITAKVSNNKTGVVSQNAYWDNGQIQLTFKKKYLIVKVRYGEASWTTIKMKYESSSTAFEQ